MTVYDANVGCIRDLIVSAIMFSCSPNERERRHSAIQVGFDTQKNPASARPSLQFQKSERRAQKLGASFV